jgi:hypothetical protein
MKLRYHTVQTKIDAEMVRAYANDNQLPTMEAKRLLENKSATILQYWDGHAEQWITVPYVTEFRE